MEARTGTRARRRPATRRLRRAAVALGTLVVAGMMPGQPARAEDTAAVTSAAAASSVHVASVTPDRGQWMDTVTVRGSGFGDKVGQVFFGATESRIVYDWSPTSISVAIPPGAPAIRHEIAVKAADNPVRGSGGRVDVVNYVLPKAGSTYMPGQIELRLGLVSQAAAVAAAHRLPALTPAYPQAEATSELARYFQVTVPEDQVADRILDLAADFQVEWAEPVSIASVDATPNDTHYANGMQWAVNRIEATTAWDHNTGGNADVGVIDSGVRANHPDMGGKILSQANYLAGGPADDCGHGTHVAGTVAAATNNGAGVAGIGWNTRVRSYRALAFDGNIAQPGCNGTQNATVNAVNQANADNVRVINMSLGTPPGTACPAALNTAIGNANNAGRLVVVAAGNDSNTTPGWPANCGGAFPVGNTDAGDQYAATSSFGNWVALSAPGTGIISTAYVNAPFCGGTPVMPDYAQCTGTSMAAPHVAAVAAMLYAEGANRGEVITELQRHATLFTCSRGPGNCGAGRLNAGKSVQGFALRSTVGLAGTPNGQGYWLFDDGARVNVFGDATWHGSMEGTALAQPASAGDNRGNSGYWMFARDGGVFAFDAPFYGGMGGRPLNCAVIGGKATPSGNGYWEVGCDGGIFNFGDAQFLGSRGGQPLNCAIVGMAVNPIVTPVTGQQGYWEVGCDGGIFAYGNAGFYGGMGGQPLAAPISAIAPTPTGRGYWMVGRDGGVFAFGDAPFLGSAVGITSSPIVGIEGHGSAGYWLLGQDGSVYAFGDAPYLGNGL